MFLRPSLILGSIVVWFSFACEGKIIDSQIWSWGLFEDAFFHFQYLGDLQSERLLIIKQGKLCYVFLSPFFTFVRNQELFKKLGEREAASVLLSGERKMSVLVCCF